MEIEKLISALEETISLLRNSRSSGWIDLSIEEIVEYLELEIVKARNSQPLATQYLSFLFAPTGAIQETSIDNGWGKEFLRIAEVIDQFIGKSK